MSQGGGSFPLGDPGGGTHYFTDDDGMSDTASGEPSVFARSGKLMRSPVLNQVGVGSKTNVEVPGSGQEEQMRLGLSPLFTPRGSKPQRSSKTGEVKKKVNELYEFIKDKHNVHHKIRELVTSIKAGIFAVEQEQQAWKVRAEKAEKELKEKTAMLAEETPRGPSSSRTGKRDRDTPGEEEVSKKQKEDIDEVEVNEEENRGWKTVQNKADKKKEKKKIEEKKNEENRKEEKKKEEKKSEKPKPHRERSKGDALIVEANDKVSYAALLRKVREDPGLKELGENVVKTRRTQRGEMLFELKKDPTVKSSAFKELVAKVLDGEATVRALTQETVIECRYLDEITTVDEVRQALQDLGQCGDVPMAIRMRKAYGGTQTATIRISTAAANKLLDIGKVKIGWAVGLLKATPRLAKQMERCFKCMGFGHLARNCDGPDRSKLCRKCGDGGHIAIDCAKPARCMLCKVEDGNDHVTGGFKCPVYKKAAAIQQ